MVFLLALSGHQHSGCSLSAVVTSARSLPRMRIMIVGRADRPVVPGVGGVEHLLLEWAAALAEEHDVIVVSHGRGAYIADMEHRLRVDPLDDSGPYNRPPTLGSSYRLPGESFERVAVDAAADVVDVAASLGVDVVSLHDDPTLAVDLALPCVFTAHTTPVRWSNQHPERVEAALSVVSVVSATSAFLADRVRVRSGRDDVALLPLFAPPAFLSAPFADVARRSVISTSRLDPESGVVDLCALWRRHAPAGTELLVADFPEWDAPRRDVDAVRSFVRSTRAARLVGPWRDRRDVAVQLAAASVFACCDVGDDPGLISVLEARAAGCRVVGFAHPAFIANAGSQAIVAPRGDHRSLAAAIDEALATPVTMRQAIRDEVALNMPLSRSVAFLESLLAQAAR